VLGQAYRWGPDDGVGKVVELVGSHLTTPPQRVRGPIAFVSSRPPPDPHSFFAVVALSGFTDA